ncbi:DNA sulfur modification protein DndC [Evansella vedderi]|uniref:DNA sulfur modification protein DndC n=1 Tax=Evansella vedderi TaxID=38282 RepID=A0ABT9ZWG8_9BACI|nr:phosphoadenosine phosphosulfate reductase family protein [Evansella vedderi]MDQ0255571.1 DNA sulfur modification protein DndC [Evansella vedderi]
MEVLSIELNELEEQRYEFKELNNRIAIIEDLKSHNNETRRIWTYLKEYHWDFCGVVRGMSAIFNQDIYDLVLHHFVNDEPMEGLMGENTNLYWTEFFSPEKPVGAFFRKLENRGYKIYIPEQAFTDAYFQSLSDEWDWHLESPKHKFMIWAKHQKATFLIEVFIDMSLRPYGVKGALKWPSLKEDIEFTQHSLFVIDEPSNEKEDIMLPVMGEEMNILGDVDDDVQAITDEAIHDIMTNHDHVCLAVSGGKDSYTTMLKVIHYLLKHPECDTSVSIVTSDTRVENPLLSEHIVKMREAVLSLDLSIDFRIVQPKIDQTYMVLVFGKGYVSPNNLFKYCVSRLKVDPSREYLEELANRYSKVCLVLGSRDTESAARSRSIKKHFGEGFYGEHPIPGIRTASPIRHWTATEVVTYLVRYPAPWKDYGNYHLINLYGSAAGGISECPSGAAVTNENDAISSCSGSGSRMGCWSCTVVKNDISLHNMALDYPELSKYIEMRSYFKAIQDIRYGGNTGYQRQRTFATFRNGLGDLTIDIRTLLLQKMKKLEIPIEDEEVTEIYKEVQKREVTEGMPVTKRFRDLLMSFYTVHPGVVGAMYNPIWDPFGTGVDQFTEDDKAAIERVLSRRNK